VTAGDGTATTPGPPQASPVPPSRDAPGNGGRGGGEQGAAGEGTATTPGPPQGRPVPPSRDAPGNGGRDGGEQGDDGEQ
jgi:hypothetical protein